MPLKNGTGRVERTQNQNQIGEILAEIHQVQVTQDNPTWDIPAKNMTMVTTQLGTKRQEEECATDGASSRTDSLRMARKLPPVVRYERRQFKIPTEERPPPGLERYGAQHELSLSLEAHFIS